MSNFGFIKGEWPAAHDACGRAESYLTSDPRSACFYARRAVEQLVQHLYDVLDLPLPYKDDLAALANDAAFKAETGNGINTKLNLIRKFGNTAVHQQQPMRPDIALHVLRELHHVMVWAAFHHSTTPQDVPTKAQFDPKLAAQAAPLSRAEVQQLAAKFKAADEAHAQALAEKEDLLAARDAEIGQLREQIKQAQAASTATDDHDYSEAETRDLFIDVLLGEAGWEVVSRLAGARTSTTGVAEREYEVTGMPVTSSSGTASGKGYVDYVLWGADGRPVAVVEAKRTRTSPQVGQRQAEAYADCLEAEFGRRPVIFCTNGYEHWLWDDAAGFPPREVQGFHTRDELELLIQRRHTRRPLETAPIDGEIAGRHYQQRAIRAIDEAFTKKQREALLVMATGSGKTRTVIGLVDQLMKAGWVKRVLFLADRTALVNQAVNAFKEHLPAATTVNLVTEKGIDGRVYASTYPTMMNIINELDDGERRFGPGHFDLVVIDEAHRSVYQKYRSIFEWFDSLLVGLTATPKDEVDHNTYRLFHLEDGVPTDAYDLDEAVAEGYLVPPVGVSVGTKFLRSGIRYDDLSEADKDEWDALDWGEDGPPDAVDAEELNKFLFNEDTVDKVLATVMAKGHKVDSGDRLGKTIVFAKNREHAEFIQQRFDANYPHLAGKFARVITHQMSYAQSLIDDFSTPAKDPHLAISVDMLDTGIDIPEVVNLVFFKAVRSKSKFWQMIGRGTRLCPDLFGPGRDKENFYVFDFCGNLEYFNQDLPGSEGSNQKSLTQRLFETRLGLVTALDTAGQHPDLRSSAAQRLHEVVRGMNLDNFLVRPHRRLVEKYDDWEAWRSLTTEDAGEILEHLAGLPSAVGDSDEDAKRFDVLILRRQLAQLEGDAVAAERIREQVRAIAAGLLTQTTIPSVAAEAERLEELADDEWWVDVTLPMLEVARQRIRGLVRFLEKVRKNKVYTDFEDELSEPELVDLPGTSTGVDVERFRAKARAYLRDHEDHVALQRLRRNKQLTPDDLGALEEMLVASGAGGPEDIAWVAERSEGLGLFVRNLVGLDKAAAVEALGDHIDQSGYTVNQIRFVDLIVDELTANGVMEPGRLFESPYTDQAPRGPDQLFSGSDVDAIVGTLREIKARAMPEGA